MSLSSILTAIKNFFAKLFGKKATTPAPTVSVNVPAVPSIKPVVTAPIVTPVVNTPNPPGPVTSPTPVIVPVVPAVPLVPVAQQWFNGMSQPDARGAVKFQAIENEITTNPNWANAAHDYFHPAIKGNFQLNAEQLLNNEANCSYCAITTNSSLVGDHPFDARSLTRGFAALPPTTGNATYTAGLQYPDVLAFPQGIPGKADPTVADIVTFIATCNQTGKYPTIGVVSGNFVISH